MRETLKAVSYTHLDVYKRQLYISLPLTLLVATCTAAMLLVTKEIGGRSGRYFIRQQNTLGDLNGYIEEMINGQRVVKVFCLSLIHI